MTSYMWDTFSNEGVYLPKSIQTDLYALQHVLEQLAIFNQIIVSHNDNGVIIDNKQSFKYIDNVLCPIITRIDGSELRLKLLEDVSSYKAKNKTENDDDTGSVLYIMYNMLPDELKQKLRIYIKKG